jgi:hypothetical protein
VKVPHVGVTMPLCLSTEDEHFQVVGSLEVMSMPSQDVLVVGGDNLSQLGIVLCSYQQALRVCIQL